MSKRVFYVLGIASMLAAWTVCFVGYLSGGWGYMPYAIALTGIECLCFKASE